MTLRTASLCLLGQVGSVREKVLTCMKEGADLVVVPGEDLEVCGVHLYTHRILGSSGLYRASDGLYFLLSRR